MRTWKDEARYFVSGSNHAGEIRGLALRGSNVGVAAPRVNAATFAALVDLEGLRGVDADGRGYKLRVFVDSGAFSEVEFTAEGPRIAKEITAEAWTEILDLYRRLALELGAQLYVVAPDCVAHQGKTLERLEEHAERLQEIHALGANVIVPVQKGERYTMAEFAEIATDLLGFLPIFGVPMKKDATTLAELDAFAAFFPATSVPRFHLLGLGLNSPRYAGALETIRARVPAAEVFCDSVRITALVGRTNGRAGGARPLTAARDALIAQGVTGVAELKAAAIGTVWEAEYQAELAAAIAAGWVDEELVDGPPSDLSTYRARAEAAAIEEEHAMITPTVQRWTDRRSSYRPAGEVINTSAFEVAKIESDSTAKAFVLRNHYLASYPAALARFGLYRGEDLVGVAVFSVPVNDATLSCFPTDPRECAELGRFVLVDQVPANGESWFLGRCFDQLRADGVAGVVSFSDPMARTSADGAIVFGGHVGTIYQAHNATFLGRARADTLRLLPDGRTLSNRAIAKVKKQERGWRAVVDLLRSYGAGEFEGDPATWLAGELARVCRTVRHPGNFKYAWALDRRIRRHLPASLPYPKVFAA
jgi:hypothetical protein